jgi:ATP-dependent protease HslVU (ClpYQ) peptidase subunit
MGTFNKTIKAVSCYYKDNENDEWKRFNAIGTAQLEPSEHTLVGDVTTGYAYVDSDMMSLLAEMQKQVDYFKKKAINRIYGKSKSSNWGIKKVLFNDPATIVIWNDGSKTVVKASSEPFDPEKGLAMAIAKKALGNKGNYYEVFKKYIKHDDVKND